MTYRLPIAYFGSIGYYQKFAQSTAVCFEIEEYYIKQTLRNRLYILGPNGVQALIIPVKKVNGNKTQMKDIQISYQEGWVRQHLNALETAYSSSPYFEHYLYDIAPIFKEKHTYLIDFFQAIHQFIIEKLALKTPFHFSTTYDLSPKEIDGRKQDEIPTNDVSYKYPQVFDKNCIFEGNLSILDALFNLGPMARTLLTNQETCK